MFRLSRIVNRRIPIHPNIGVGVFYSGKTYREQYILVYLHLEILHCARLIDNVKRRRKKKARPITLSIVNHSYKGNNKDIDKE